MDYKYVILKIQDGVATVTLNRPEALNALNAAVLEDLRNVLHSLEKDEDVSVVVLTGGEIKAFAAGADLAHMSKMGPLDFKEYNTLLLDVTGTIRRMPKPVVGAINGFAFGGGCSLALACDLLVASEKAKFGQQEINVGIFGGAATFSKFVSRFRASEVVMLGEIYTAEQFREWGIVNWVVPREKLFEFTADLCKKLAAKPHKALALAKEAISTCARMPSSLAVGQQSNLLSLCFGTPDQREGMSAFVEKRTPVFNKK